MPFDTAELELMLESLDRSLCVHCSFRYFAVSTLLEGKALWRSNTLSADKSEQLVDCAGPCKGKSGPLLPPSVPKTRSIN